MAIYQTFKFWYNSLGSPNKDRQQFVDAIVLISAPDWSKTLSNFEIVVETPIEFDRRTLNNARFCQTDKDLEFAKQRDLPRVKTRINVSIYLQTIK